MQNAPNIIYNMLELTPKRVPYRLGECKLLYSKWVVLLDGRVNACVCRDAYATLIIGDLKEILDGRTRRKIMEYQAKGIYPAICRNCTFYRSVYE